MRGLLAENPYVPGAPELLRALKAAGVKVALVSAGFTLNTDPIMTEFGLDYCLANELIVVDGVLDGRAVNYVPEGGKAAFTRGLMADLGVGPEETLAAGDLDGDLELFESAGVRLAVNPRSVSVSARWPMLSSNRICSSRRWIGFECVAIWVICLKPQAGFKRQGRYTQVAAISLRLPR